MITYLEGKLFKKEADRIVVLVNGLGYEVMLPTIIRQTYNARQVGDEVTVYISYHQSERQPKPLLIGFNLEPEREFFEKFIQVETIGPTKAVKALTLPIHIITRAIEERDLDTLKKLKGVGGRLAEKIVATLHGKVGKFALMREDMIPAASEPEDIKKQVEDILIKELGHKITEARQMIDEALKRNPAVTLPEELFEEVYRGMKKNK